mgnify:FL=1
MTQKTFITILVFILAPITSFSQANDEANHFIVFKSGKKLVGNEVIKKGRILFLDEKAYELNTVMFYQNNKGNFAKTPFGFQNRIIDGKVSVYSSFSISIVNPNKNLNLKNSWYTMDYSFVKRTSYSNLREDLKDNVSSMQYLNSYRNLNVLGWGLSGAGLGITLYSLSQAFDPTQSFTFNIPNTIYVGLAAILSGVIIVSVPPRKMFKAIQAYNNSSKVKL